MRALRGGRQRPPPTPAAPSTPPRAWPPPPGPRPTPQPPGQEPAPPCPPTGRRRPGGLPSVARALRRRPPTHATPHPRTRPLRQRPPDWRWNWGGKWGGVGEVWGGTGSGGCRRRPTAVPRTRPPCPLIVQGEASGPQCPRLPPFHTRRQPVQRCIACRHRGGRPTVVRWPDAACLAQCRRPPSPGRRPGLVGTVSSRPILCLLPLTNRHAQDPGGQAGWRQEACGRRRRHRLSPGQAQGRTQAARRQQRHRHYGQGSSHLPAGPERGRGAWRCADGARPHPARTAGPGGALRCQSAGGCTGWGGGTSGDPP